MNKNIFVSSTFKDFQCERNFIQNELTVALNDRLTSTYMSGVYFVDLRWGIDTSDDSGLNKVVSICIDAVKDAKPYFVIMLGDSYGSMVEASVVEAIYKSNGLRFDGRARSVTEMEIDASGLFDGENDRVLVLVRNITNLPSGDTVYYQGATAQLQQQLRNKVLEHAKAENVLYYDATVTDDGLTIDQAKIQDFILARLVHFYEQDVDSAKHNLSLRQLFNTDNAVLEQDEIDETLADIEQSFDDELLYLICGPTGSGKTALMIELYERLKTSNKAAGQFVYYTSKEYHPYLILRNLLKEAGVEADDNLFAMFTRLDPNERYFFFIDGYEAIQEDDSFCAFIDSVYVPNNVMFIVSTRMQADEYTPYHEMRSLTAEQVTASLRNTFASLHKELSPQFLQYFCANLPQSMQQDTLLLRVFVDTLCYLSMDDYRRLAAADNYSQELTLVFKEKLNAFPRTIEQFITDIIKQDDTGFSLVVLATVALSFKGVDIMLLCRMLVHMGVDFSESDFSILRHKLRSFLLVTNDGRYYIIHPSIREMVLALLTDSQVRNLAYSYISLLGTNVSVLNDHFKLEETLRMAVRLQDYELLTNLLSQLYQYGQRLDEKGFLFASVTNQVFVNQVSDVFVQIAKQGNVYADAFLLQYCMPYLSESYVEKACDMFCDMYHTITANEHCVDEVVVADATILYIATNVANFNFEPINEAMRNVAERGFNEIVYKSVLRANALDYNAQGVQQVLEDIAETFKASEQLSLSLHSVYEILHSILLLEANAAYIDSNVMSNFYEVIHQVFARDQHRQDVSVILMQLEYLGMMTGNFYPYSENIADASFEVYYKPLYLMLDRFFSLQQASIANEQVADAYDDYLYMLNEMATQNIPASTLELFSVSHLFYRATGVMNYEFNLELKQETFSELAAQFVDKLSSGAYCPMLMSHAIQSAVSALICGIDTEYHDENLRRWDELVALLKQRRTPTNSILNEINNVISDAANWGYLDSQPSLIALLEQLTKSIL